MSNVVSLEKIRDEVFSLTPDELIKSVVRKEDFAIINGKIEPTRDLMLKLSAVTKTKKIDTTLANVTVKGNDTIYIFKATIELGQKTATAHGACSTAEIAGKRNSRVEHDAMATAETRAIKRAFEEVVGLPFINEIILKLFGGYEKEEKEEEQIQQVQQQQAQQQPQQQNQVQPATEKQLKAIMALLKGKSRDERLQIVSSILGREVTTSKELTKKDASKIIDALQGNIEPF